MLTVAAVTRRTLVRIHQLIVTHSSGFHSGVRSMLSTVPEAIRSEVSLKVLTTTVLCLSIPSRLTAVRAFACAYVSVYVPYVSDAACRMDSILQCVEH
jgi:hypothetical protein